MDTKCPKQRGPGLDHRWEYVGQCSHTEEFHARGAAVRCADCGRVAHRWTERDVVDLRAYIHIKMYQHPILTRTQRIERIAKEHEACPIWEQLEAQDR